MGSPMGLKGENSSYNSIEMQMMSSLSFNFFLQGKKEMNDDDFVHDFFLRKS